METGAIRPLCRALKRVPDNAYLVETLVEAIKEVLALGWRRVKQRVSDRNVYADQVQEHGGCEALEVIAEKQSDAMSMEARAIFAMCFKHRQAFTDNLHR